MRLILNMLIIIVEVKQISSQISHLQLDIRQIFSPLDRGNSFIYIR